MPLSAQAALYLPGETLDPACAPTDSNCGISTIVASSTANSIPYYAANGSSLSATSTFQILANGTASTTNLIVTNSLTLGSLAGFLKATAGAIATSLINLASDVTGILAVGNGGTGWGAIQASTIPYGNGTSALATTTTGTAGYVLAYLGGVPTWTATSSINNGVTSVTGTWPLISSGGTTPNLTWGGLATTSQPASSNLLVSNGTAGVYGIGTTSATCGTGVSCTGFNVLGTSNPSFALATLGSAGVLGAPTATTPTVQATSTLYGNIGTGGYGSTLSWDGTKLAFMATTTTFSGTTGQFPYFSGTNTLTATSSLFFATSGNVGIGTTSPQTKFEIVNTSSGVAQDQLFLSNLASATSTASRLSFRANDVLNATTTGAITAILNQNFNMGTSSLAFSTLQSGGLTEVMRIDGLGRVGIGTTTPDTKLTVVGTIESTIGGFKFPDATIQTTAAGTVVSVQVFTSSGTYTPVAGLKYAVVRLVGGGGGGGGSNSGGDAGGGGGGGGYAEKVISAATIGASQTVTIGAGGGGGGGGGNGGAGETSSFGALLNATGGAAGNGSSSFGTSGSAGGVGSGGDLNSAGNGGATGHGVNGGNGFSGNGGGSMLGGGGNGVKASAAGVAGGAYGGGGSGGAGTSQGGGGGAAGVVIVTEYK